MADSGHDLRPLPEPRLWGSPEIEQRVVDEQTLKRLVTEDDVAAMVLFLASDDSEMCSAHVYHVDGGWV